MHNTQYTILSFMLLLFILHVKTGLTNYIQQTLLYPRVTNNFITTRAPSSAGSSCRSCRPACTCCTRASMASPRLTCIRCHSGSWLLAQLRVVHPADARQELLLVCPGLLLRLAAGSLGDAPLGLPINPHVAELISCEKCLRVFPVEPVSTKYVICKFCQNGSSLGVPSQIF